MTRVIEMDPRHVRRLDRRTFIVHHDGEIDEVCNAANLPRVGETDDVWGRVQRVAVECDLDEPGVFTVHVDYLPRVPGFRQHELN